MEEHVAGDDSAHCWLATPSAITEASCYLCSRYGLIIVPEKQGGQIEIHHDSAEKKQPSAVFQDIQKS